MKPEDKIAALVAILLGCLLLVCVSCAHAEDKDQWAIDGTTGLHFGISAGMGYTFNSVMIAAERGRPNTSRDIAAFGMCMIPGIAKEYAMDEYPSYTDLAADIAGCAVGVWVSKEMWVTVKDNMVVVHGRF